MPRWGRASLISNEENAMLYTISKRHGVPAKRGGKIKFTDIEGKTFFGTIIGTVGSSLKVKFKGLVGTRPIHPEWNVEYLG